MGKIVRIVLLFTVLVTVGCTTQPHSVIILSTNDIHAKIQRFPQLAAAVEMCRDTAEVILVDAGDRWTGNAFVDLAEHPRRPIIDLMNDLGYDVATLGNHEFDGGQAFLGDMLARHTKFQVVCANIISDTATLAQPLPYTVVTRGGVKFGFVGVVTNYDKNNHPAGHDSSFVGLRFPDPQTTAAEYAPMVKDCDVKVLISHMGDDRDIEFAAKNSGYDLIIGGHSHKQIDSMVVNTLVTQTGKNLNNIGVTQVLMRGRKVESITFRNIPLSGYTPDAAYQAKVDAYYANPELPKAIGEFADVARKPGLANMMTRSIKERMGADVGMYHIGGVRLDSIPRGGVSTAAIFDLEPFGSMVCTMKMTRQGLRRMIMTKFNDTVNMDESHRVDIFATTPYTIVVDSKFTATDVLFPELSDDAVYTIAVSDYIFKNYADMDYVEGTVTEIPVTDVVMEYIRRNSPLTPDNGRLQAIK